MSCCSFPRSKNRGLAAAYHGKTTTKDVARIRIAGGPTLVGTDTAFIAEDGEGPPRSVKVSDFFLEPFAVSNARFRDFVEDTGYVTDAERFGWSYVFSGLLCDDAAPATPQIPEWWRKAKHASWRQPEGAGSTIETRLDHPATHISWNDASAFSRWIGGRLPTEAEWEYAARGGDQEATFPWGSEEPSDEFTPCNIWQGTFPSQNTLKDGYLGTAPVDSFVPNPFGLYNMSGNVWEWCSDAFKVRSLSRSAKGRNKQASREDEHVLKGGSYLCHKSYCYRYRIAARSGRSTDTSAGHTGFRVAYDT
jgi:formylglycine-generating enzyme